MTPPGRPTAHFLFNTLAEPGLPGATLRETAARLSAAEMWGVQPDEQHRDALAPGDLVLLYVGAPERVFVGHGEVASSFHGWTPSEAQRYPGDLPGGVLLTRIEHWDPPVAMHDVLSVMDPSQKATADFDMGVVGITEQEYETALEVGRHHPLTR